MNNENGKRYSQETERWSGSTRNWNPIQSVTLNPMKELTIK
ncbi:hypothetical protein [Paenisporosarcina sp. TG20]|nr:hypothetical protein [Paenisporosarcina sp. TG20]